MRKRKMTHFGDPVFYDERGRMYKISGNARVYLNQEIVKEIEAKKKK